MKNRNLLLLVCLALVMSALAACLPQAPAASTFPTGKFVDAKNEYAGYYFNEDMTWSYFVYGEIGAQGKYSVKNNRWTEEGTKGECPFPATYEWAFDGTNLTFKLIGEDKCDPRREATDGQTFLLVNEVGASASGNLMSEIKVDAADFSYSAPETVNAGWVRVTLTNSGQEPHHVQFLRLNDGVTLVQFEEALKQGEGPALALTRQVGGVGAVTPGASAQAVLNLPVGEYVILCLIPSPGDRVAHHAKGMLKSLSVAAASSPASEPQAGLTVHMADFKFDLPDSLLAGPLTIQVINDGPEAHELNILKLSEGKTVDDVVQFLNGAGGPPPFIPVGGMNGLDKGLSGYAELNLEPGKYVAICNIPSPKAEGHPHFALGMLQEFSVEAK